MARMRTIKPGIFQNDDMAEIEPLGRLLFMGLWCYADREGRIEDRPRRFKAEILPYDDCKIDDFLNQLDKKEFIKRYEVAGKKYIQIVKFLIHQRPNKKEIPSQIPPLPKEHDPDTFQNGSGDDPEHAGGGSGKSLSVALPNLTGTGQEPTSDLTENENEQPPEEEQESGFECEEQNQTLDHFETLKKAYPKKSKEGAAKRAWQSVTMMGGRNPSDHLKICLVAIEEQKQTKQWQKDNGDYIPSLDKWLLDGQWSDEVEYSPTSETEKDRKEKYGFLDKD